VIVLDLLEAIIKLGLPVMGLSWLLVHRRYQSGEIAFGADHKEIKSSLKQFKKNWRKEKKERKERGEPGDRKAKAKGKFNSYDMMENKWMRFGGGFYGVTALTTFLVIELGEAISFISNLPALAGLFEDGVFDLIISILVNQLQNFLAALIWFTYWIDEGGSIFIWIGVPYVSYLLGIKLGSRSLVEVSESSALWVKEVKEKIKTKNTS
jgi:hypothetical protein